MGAAADVQRHRNHLYYCHPGTAFFQFIALDADSLLYWHKEIVLVSCTVLCTDIAKINGVYCLYFCNNNNNNHNNYRK